MVKPSRRKEMAQQIVADRGISVRVACAAFGISQSCYRYQPILSNENEEIADKLVQLTTAHTDWGFGLCFAYLRNVEGHEWNHKRVYRIYREQELNLRIKPRRRLQRAKPEPLAEPVRSDQVWSIDFMQDHLTDGRSYRVFNVLDDYRREGLAMEADFSLPSLRVIRILENILEWRSVPAVIRCDNGPEFTSQAFTTWARRKNIKIEYIQPGKPQQNAYVERHNRTVRYGWINKYRFETIQQVQEQATKWLWFYNNIRPHKANGGYPPLKVV